MLARASLLPTQNRTRQIMLTVVLALLPGMIAETWAFGWHVLLQAVLASVFAVAVDSLFLSLRQHPWQLAAKEGSAVVTGLLLALAMPATAPWWVTCVAVAAALGLGKHAYGGLGQNIFNPAMVGYAVVLVSFPDEMTHWPVPAALHGVVDGYTGATPMDTVRQLQGEFEKLATAPSLRGHWAGVGWEWVNLGFLLGGLGLLARGIVRWHVPVSLMGTLGFLSLIAFAMDPQRYSSPLFHLFSGGIMLGAFFVATDPVTGATSPRGKLIFGAGVGALIFFIRTAGNYVDGIAFAVLIMNMFVPLIDRWTLPRTYGHARSLAAEQNTERH